MGEMLDEAGPVFDLRQHVRDPRGGQHAVAGERELSPLVLSAVILPRFLGEAQPLAGEQRGIAPIQITSHVAQGAVELRGARIEPGVRVAERERLLRYGSGCRREQHVQRPVYSGGRDPDVARCQRVGGRAVGRHFPMRPVDFAGDHDMAAPATLDMAERQVSRKRLTPVAIEVHQDRHRAAAWCRRGRGNRSIAGIAVPPV